MSKKEGKKTYPIETAIPNEETQKAFQEVKEKGHLMKRYKDVRQLFKDIDDEQLWRRRNNFWCCSNSSFQKGQYKDCLECHIEGDFLIIWIQDNEEKVIYLMRLGSHSELFK